jgi:hypothetical protein
MQCSSSLGLVFVLRTAEELCATLFQHNRGDPALLFQRQPAERVLRFVDWEREDKRSTNGPRLGLDDQIAGGSCAASDPHVPC